MRKLRVAAVALGVAAVAVPVAYGAGYFPYFPIVGAPTYCSSVAGTGQGLGTSTPNAGTFPTNQAPLNFVQGNPQGVTPGGSFTINCNSFVPSGPPVVTGSELIPADTQLANGQQPQTVLIPSSTLGSPNSQVNQLIGGDFATNLWQRGTTFSALTPTTATITADRTYVYSSGNTVTVSKQTGASDTLPTLGLYASMRVSRPSGTNTSQICVGQVLDKLASRSLLGNNAVLSFYAQSSTSFSTVSSGSLQVNIAYYTAADSATPGTNTGTFATGLITGYTAAVTGLSSGVTGLVASGVATIPITTSFNSAATNLPLRYAAYATIPTTNAAGTAITGVGVSICYTPTSGTGASTEWFEIEGVQLQALPSVATAALPNGVVSPTVFEKRNPQWEADYQYWYTQVLTDGAATQRYAMCQSTTTTTDVCLVQFTNPMREVPATTVSTATSYAGTIPAGTAQACTTLAAVASSNTISGGTLQCTVAANLVAGSSSQLIGAATGGTVVFSAEP